jgi:hypothetical protein
MANAISIMTFIMKHMQGQVFAIFTPWHNLDIIRRHG